MLSPCQLSPACLLGRSVQHQMVGAAICLVSLTFLSAAGMVAGWTHACLKPAVLPLCGLLCTALLIFESGACELQGRQGSPAGRGGICSGESCAVLRGGAAQVSARPGGRSAGRCGDGGSCFAARQAQHPRAGTAATAHPCSIEDGAVNTQSCRPCQPPSPCVT